MSSNDATVVLAHGAWADGSSWAKVINSLAAQGIQVIAVPLPLTITVLPLPSPQTTIRDASAYKL